MNELTTRTPGLIAAEINKIKEDTRKVVIHNSIEIGKRLEEAKELVEYGEWGIWLETEVNYSKSTANNLMKIFREYGADQISLIGDNLKSQAFGDLTYSQAVLLLGVPQEDREKFIEENTVEDLSTRELKKKIEELKKLTKDKEVLANERDAAYENLKELEESNKDLEESNRVLEEAFNSNVEEKNKLIEEINNLNNEIENVKNQPIELNVTPNENDEEVQAKLNKLKREKEEAERKLLEIQSSNNESAIRYKVHFNTIKNTFKSMLEELEEMKDKNEVDHSKYKNATRNLLNMMSDRL